MTAGDSPEVKVYRARWLMLAIFAYASAVNSMQTYTFAPISAATADFFDVDLGGVYALGAVFLGLFVPGAALTGYVAARRGLGAVTRLGAALTLAGSLARALACAARARLGARRAYATMLLGQSVVALAQPVFTNAAVRLADAWFGERERDLAASLAVLANLLGNALGQVLPPLVVRQRAAAGDDGDGGDDARGAYGGGMPALMGAQAAMAALAGALALALFRGAPATPPSLAVASQRDDEAAAALLRASHASCASLNDGGEGPPPATGADAPPRAGGLRANVAAVAAPYFAVLRDPQFGVLLFMFSLGVGFFNGMMVVIAEWLAPLGFSAAQAGAVGGAVLGAGLFSAVGAGAAMDATHA